MTVEVPKENSALPSQGLFGRSRELTLHPNPAAFFFASVIDLGTGGGLAICTDGVGTKVLIAEMVGRYDTIGVDCIAMNVTT